MRKPFHSICVMMLLHLSAIAQTDIKGKVLDAQSGLPLAGVSVVVKGGHTGVQTDDKGNFNIQTKQKKVILIASFVGFDTREIAINDNYNISIALSPAMSGLQNVVVVAYGTQEKNRITGSVTKVEGNEFMDIPLTSVDQMLQGKVAGLQSVAVSGQPGALQQIRIRGTGSINASSEPLFVINGIPVNSGDFTSNTTTSNALAGINPNDIESVSVLKDAASTSLYGSRAANGVIIITTKKGIAGKTNINFNSEYGIGHVAYLNSLTKPLSANQYTSLSTIGLVNSGLDTAGAVQYLNDAFQADNGYNTDWQDLVNRTGINQEYNLSLSGGDNKTTFYASGGYFNQKATTLASSLSRYSASLNIQHNLNNRISVGIGIEASYLDQATPYQSGSFRNPVMAGLYLRPFQHPYNQDGTYDYSAADFEQIYNPLAIAHYDRQKLGNTKLLGNAGGIWHIQKNLDFSTMIGIDYFNLEEEGYYNPFFGDAASRQGEISNIYTRVFNWVWTNMLNYHGILGKGGEIYFDIKVGYEAQKSQEYTITATGSGLPELTTLSLPQPAVPETAAGDGSDYSFSGAFTSVQADYKNRFSLSGSLRRDGSSRFGVNNQYGTFWSLGGAWNIDRERFLINSNFISGLKLRASYGSIGNAETGNYNGQSLFGFGNNVNGFSNHYNQSPGGSPASVGNPNLTWEKNNPFDIGLELGLLKNRLTIESDLYVRLTSQLIQNVPLSLTSGFATYPDNIGSMRNQGLELTIQATPVISRYFRWDLALNIAFNRNRVISLNGGQDIINGTHIIRVGRDVESIYTLLWAGVDPATGSGLWYTDSTRKSTTADVTHASNCITGSSSPKGFGGFWNSFTYKDFSLGAQFNFQYGNLLFDQWGFLNESDGAFFNLNQNQRELKSWQKPGDITDMPQYVAGNTSQSNATSTRYFYKGDFVRLRNLMFSWQVPKRMLVHAGFNSIMIYVRGTNLWTKAYDRNLGFDPEQPVDGSNDLQVPIQKIFSFGLNLNF